MNEFYGVSRSSQPIADEVVELGTLADGEWFEFRDDDVPWGAGDSCQRLGPFREMHHDYIRAHTPDGIKGSWDPTRKVRRVPAPTWSANQVNDITFHLGDLKCDCWFRFSPDQEYGGALPGLWRVDSIGMIRVRARDTRGHAKMFHTSLVVIPVPAPTPTQQPSGRPPCDACGDESVTNRGWNESVFGHHLCAAHWKWSANQINEASARRAKTSGSTQPGAGHESILTDPNPFQLWGDRPAPKAEPRWSTTDPTRIAALEAKLAGQVASGGQDCKPARSLIERADDLRREEEGRKLTLTYSDADGRREARGVDPFVQPGPRLMRHELPTDQKLDRKLTGR